MLIVLASFLIPISVISTWAITTYEPGASPFQARERAPLMARTFPVTTQLPNYPQRNARNDLIAGITVAALAIPSAMAYAELAGLSPVAGLYALLLPAVAYAFLGSSRQIVVGPEGVLSLLVATAVAPIAAGASSSEYAALAAMLAIIVGAIAVVGRIIRIGWVADYFSRSVLVGYRTASPSSWSRDSSGSCSASHRGR